MAGSHDYRPARRLPARLNVSAEALRKAVRRSAERRYANVTIAVCSG